MILALLIIVGAVLVLSSSIMLMGIAEAPEGWEDEAGFHIGPEPAPNAVTPDPSHKTFNEHTLQF